MDTEAPTPEVRDRRGQLIVLTAAVLAVGLLTIAAAYAQLGSTAMTAPTAEQPGTADVTVALELATQEALDTEHRAWTDRQALATAVGNTFDLRATRVERVASNRKVTYHITRRDRQTVVPSEVCDGRPTSCTTIDGVVIQRYGTRAVAVGVIVDIKMTTATGVTHSTSVIAPPP